MKFLSIFLFVALAPAPAAAQTCDIPAGYSNSTSIQDGDFLVRFATDKSVYAPGELVQFYLAVKNTGAFQQYFNFGVSPEDAYAVMPDTCASLPDCDDTIYSYPPIVYYYNSGTTLDPGECRVWAHTSSAAPFDITMVGMTFNVQGGLYQVAPSEPFWALPAGGLVLSVYVDDSVAVEESTWGAVKARYR